MTQQAKREAGSSIHDAYLTGRSRSFGDRVIQSRGLERMLSQSADQKALSLHRVGIHHWGSHCIHTGSDSTIAATAIHIIMGLRKQFKMGEVKQIRQRITQPQQSKFANSTESSPQRI